MQPTPQQQQHRRYYQQSRVGCSRVPEPLITCRFTGSCGAVQRCAHGAASEGAAHGAHDPVGTSAAGPTLTQAQGRQRHVFHLLPTYRLLRRHCLGASSPAVTVHLGHRRTRHPDRAKCALPTRQDVQGEPRVAHPAAGHHYNQYYRESVARNHHGSCQAPAA